MPDPQKDSGRFMMDSRAIYGPVYDQGLLPAKGEFGGCRGEWRAPLKNHSKLPVGGLFCLRSTITVVPALSQNDPGRSCHGKNSMAPRPCKMISIK